MPLSRRRGHRHGGLAAALTAALVAALLGGCGNDGTSGANPGTSTCHGTVVVALAPGQTTAVTDGVHLAISRANAAGVLAGCSARQMTPTGATAIAQIHSAINTAAVVGVIGPATTAEAVAEVPLANADQLAVITPTLTDPGLTVVGADPAIDTANLRASGDITLFRTCATDLTSAGALATTALALGPTSLVFADPSVDGGALALRFEARLRGLGGSIPLIAPLPATPAAVRAELRSFPAATAVLVDGTTPEVGTVATAMALTSSHATLLGGTALADDASIPDGQIPARAVVPSPATTTLSAMANAYRHSYGVSPPPSALAAYDATTALLVATGDAIAADGGGLPSAGLRAQVVGALATVSFVGATGRVGFDRFGDDTGQVESLFSAADGEWAPIETLVPAPD